MQNDHSLCHCESEKPFHECCKKDITIEKSGRTTYPEPYVINRFRNHSSRFARFYDENRHKVGNVVWFNDETDRYYATKSDPYQIHIANPELNKLDEYAIAHEFAHLIFYELGFPLTRLKTEYRKNEDAQKLASAIHTMIHDLLVQEFVQAYDYPLKELFEAEKAAEKKVLMPLFREPTGHYDFGYWSFNFASALLDWHQIDPTSEHEYFKWYTDRYPKVAAAGREIAMQVQSSKGYETPAKVNELYKILINTNRIKKFFQ